MARNSRDFQKSDSESQKETIEKLKSQIRKLQKENAKLKSENSTLMAAWGKTELYLKDVTKNKSLMDIIKNVDSPLQSGEKCTKCTLIMKTIKIGNIIFSHCSCGNRKQGKEVE